ncbi:ParB N-terminal domain-containing protein [Streptomyces sp. NPDC056405]|uniref:ParB N-terminal domain-containing protein n=1 Tax=Streptomyces sp. NPDC056405 TaxID=3345811 RepID=UPI0035DE58A9
MNAESKGTKPVTLDGEGSDYLIDIRDRGLQHQPTAFVPVDELSVTYTPRVRGEDVEYAHQLADAEASLPPILVHRPTMTVIDGVHRLRAARIRGDQNIAVRLFDGSEQDAALLAIAVNVAQGRPLSPDDRAAAAGRVLTAKPQWSDRAVAAVVGLSPAKVAQIRQETAGSEGLRFRVGRDGRARPLDAARGRRLASELIRSNPDAPLRRIAREAGIAPATVADVRDRMRRGEDPVPPKLRLLAAGPDQPPEPAARGVARPHPVKRDAVEERPSMVRGSRGVSATALRRIVRSLRRDPSLRFSESGRNMLRLLEVCGLITEDHGWLTEHTPAHCKEMLRRLAEGYAEAWWLLAEDLRRGDENQPRSAVAVGGEGAMVTSVPDGHLSCRPGHRLPDRAEVPPSAGTWSCHST